VTAYLYDLGSTQTMQGPGVSLTINKGGIFPGSTIFVVAAISSGWYSVLDTPKVTDHSGNNYKLAASLQNVDDSGTAYVWLGLFYCQNCRQVDGLSNITINATTQGQQCSTAIAAFFATGIVTVVEPLATIRTAQGRAGKPKITSTLSMTPGDLMVAVCSIQPWPANTIYHEDTTAKWVSPPFQKISTADAVVGIAGPTVINPNGSAGLTWAPNVTATNFWLAIMGGFKVAQTTVMPIATDIVVGSPEIDQSRFAVFGKMVPRPLIVQPPFIGIPSTVVATPQVVCLTHRDDGVMESLFTNVNVDFSLEGTPGTLVGRTSAGRGQVEAINVKEPLVLTDGVLSLDVVSLTGDLENRVTNLEAAVYPMVIEMGGVHQALNNINDQLTAINQAIAALQAQVGGSSNIYLSTNYMYSIGAPEFGQPTVNKPLLGPG
jgi:hypothetical protein